MKSKKEFVEFGKEKLEKLRKTFEELEVQVNLGAKEAKETFEKEMNKFSSFLNEQKARVQKDHEKANESLLELIGKFETLELLLSQEGPSATSDFATWKAETLQAIYKLEFEIREKSNLLTFPMRARIYKFKSILDDYRLALALSQSGENEEAKAQKKILQEKMDELREKVKREEEGEGTFDHFVEELSTSFDHLRKAFKDLL